MDSSRPTIFISLECAGPCKRTGTSLVSILVVRLVYAGIILSIIGTEIMSG